MTNLRAILSALFQRAFDPFRAEENRGVDTYQPRQKVIMSGHLVAICVGHSRTGDNGALSADNTTEWDYNRRLASELHDALFVRKISAFIVDEYDGNGYGAAMRWVAGHVEQKHASLAVELHFNAANGSAQGHEWLYWASSTKSKKLAESVRDAFVSAFPVRKSRGARGKTSGDRGAEFLRLTHCPAIICEPFFGDNLSEWEFAKANMAGIADAIAEGISNHLKV